MSRQLSSAQLTAAWLVGWCGLGSSVKKSVGWRRVDAKNLVPKQPTTVVGGLGIT